jgi:predicted nucleic acid-binding protein
VGRRVAEPDLRSAAIALARDATLVTGNVRHFAHVPDLPNENWLVDEPA